MSTPDSPPNTVLRSRELAALGGVTVRTLRHYHSIGLLPEPARDPNGYRRYTLNDLLRLLRIRELTAAGVPLRDIAGDADPGAELQATALTQMEAHLRAQIERLESQRLTVERMRAGLAQSRSNDRHLARTRIGQLDHQIWSLVRATAIHLDPEVQSPVPQLAQALHAATSADWYRAFEQLQDEVEIDPETAEGLARLIVSFAGELAQGSPASLLRAQPVLPLARFIDRLVATSLSPAQHTVWVRFLEIWSATGHLPHASGPNGAHPEFPPH